MEDSRESREAKQGWKYGLWIKDKPENYKVAWRSRRLKGLDQLGLYLPQGFVGTADGFSSCPCSLNPHPPIHTASKGVKHPQSSDFLGRALNAKTEACSRMSEMAFIYCPIPWRSEPQKFIPRAAILLDLWHIVKISWLRQWFHGHIHTPRCNKL